MITKRDGVTALTRDIRTALVELTPLADDPHFEEVWAVLMQVTNVAGARLLEPRFGQLLEAADEVRLYLAQLERVARVSIGAPIRVPMLAARPLRAAGRFLDSTREADEIVAFLMEVPGLTEAFSSHLIRTAGMQSRPLVDVLDLATRAGAVFLECMERVIPGITLTPNN